MINLGLLICLILFFIFETNVIVEYGKKYKLPIPLLKEYLNIIENGGQSHYLTFIKGVYNNFWGNLVSCYICLSVWLSLFISLITFNLLHYPKINFIALIGYLILKVLNKLSVNK